MGSANGKIKPFIPRDRLEPGYKGLNDLVFAANGEVIVLPATGVVDFAAVAASFAGS